MKKYPWNDDVLTVLSLHNFNELGHRSGLQLWFELIHLDCDEVYLDPGCEVLQICECEYAVEGVVAGEKDGQMPKIKWIVFMRSNLQQFGYRQIALLFVFLHPFELVVYVFEDARIYFWLNLRVTHLVIWFLYNNYLILDNTKKGRYHSCCSLKFKVLLTSMKNE